MFQDRYAVRREVAEAIKQLSAVLKEWVNDVVLDQQRFEAFHASGHQGEYQELPKGTLARKLEDLGWTAEHITALNTLKTPLDLSDIQELDFAADRVERMLQWFAVHPEGGSFHHVCVMYEAVGSLIRRLVIQQTGHPPEQFATPDVTMTGGKEEAKRVQPTPYRAPLFPDDEVKP